MSISSSAIALTISPYVAFNSHASYIIKCKLFKCGKYRKCHLFRALTCYGASHRWALVHSQEIWKECQPLCYYLKADMPFSLHLTQISHSLGAIMQRNSKTFSKYGFGIICIDRLLQQLQCVT